MKQEAKPKMRTRPLRDDELEEAVNHAREHRMKNPILKMHLPEWWEGHELWFNGTKWQFIDTVSDVPLVYGRVNRKEAEERYQSMMDDPFAGPVLIERIRAMVKEGTEYAVAV